MRQSDAARLVMRGIHKRFGATVALGGVDLEVRAGEVMALLGENGAGKSTLMKILAGAIEADEGAMTLEGEAYAPRGPLEARRRGVSMIYQELSLAPHLSVMENILLGIEAKRLGFMLWRRMRRLAREALAQLDHADLSPDAIVGELPIATQQIVEIARAVVLDVLAQERGLPGGSVIVLDEPTSSLGRDDVRRLFEVIVQLRERGSAIIYISHFIEEAKQIADRFTVLRDGKTVATGLMSEASTDAIITHMVGREVTDMYPRSQRESGEMVLSTASLAGVPLPREATLSLHRGEVLGVAGLVGAGRTELLRTIFGLDAVRNGEVRVAMASRASMAASAKASPAKRLKQGVGLLSEDRKEEGLAVELSLADNLTLSKLSPFGRVGLVRGSKQLAAAARWVERLGIRCAGPDQRVAELSGGNQQKVAIGRLLHHDVDVLLMDEPTRGVDVGSKAQIYQLIDDLAKRGKAVLLVSSYLPELLGVCDRIAVMHRGVLGEAKPADEWDQSSLLAAAIGTEDDSEEAA